MCQLQKPTHYHNISQSLFNLPSHRWITFLICSWLTPAYLKKGQQNLLARCTYITQIMSFVRSPAPCLNILTSSLLFNSCQVYCFCLFLPLKKHNQLRMSVLLNRILSPSRITQFYNCTSLKRFSLSYLYLNIPPIFLQILDTTYHVFSSTLTARSVHFLCTEQTVQTHYLV